ncbi:MAG: GbsR/MarR family transcriptional regulator [Longimicrobiales bacterium]
MDDTTQSFIERIGLKFETDGMPRTSGRMVGLLLLSADDRSLDELAELLQVSKGSISSNARLLERMGAVERVSHPGDRRDYYRTSEDMHARVLDLWIRQLRDLRDLMVDALKTPPARHEKVRKRLEGKAECFTHMIDELKSARERWRTRSVEPLPRAAGYDG